MGIKLTQPPSSCPAVVANTLHRTTEDAIDGIIEGDGAGGYSVSYFGMELESAAAEAESSVTGDNNFHEKLKLTTAVLPAGDYLIGWYCEVALSSTANAVKARVQVDDTDTIAYFKQKPTTVYSGTGWIPVTGFKISTLTAAAHDVDIDYGTNNAAPTTYIRFARIKIWRVS